jgi:hypothetical protein
MDLCAYLVSHLRYRASVHWKDRLHNTEFLSHYNLLQERPLWPSQPWPLGLHFLHLPPYFLVLTFNGGIKGENTEKGSTKYLLLCINNLTDHEGVQHYSLAELLPFVSKNILQHDSCNNCNRRKNSS